MANSVFRQLLSYLLLPAGHLINPYQHLMTRIEPKQIEAMIAANKAPSDTQATDVQSKPTIGYRAN